ncbi:uncharacterized protein PAC_02891 [Phialocephala subalpina]|uniref:Uncharacterized protein n=1 Tax=Phialocephala subalpina TaxID=576137 RepID=A0A1L7WJT6_9HELO|nr:uncharacterized protein PAC_02891 [Phialocephala subalpina]
MLPRFKGLAVLTFTVLALYVVFWREETPFQSGQHAVDVLKGTFGDVDVELSHDAPQTHDAPPVSVETKLPESGYLKDLELEPKPTPTPTPTKSVHGPYFSELPAEDEEDTAPAEWEEHAAENTEFGQEPSTDESAERPAVAEPENDYGRTGLQVQFDKEYAALGLNENAGAIYGATLNSLVDTGAHEGFAAAALKSTDSPVPYSDTPPYSYNPYPDYNSKAWHIGNQGTFVACNGHKTVVKDLLVFSGHSKGVEPQMGSYIPLDIDSNLCFERETRLGPYRLKGDAPDPAATSNAQEARDVATVDWGKLQQICYKRNSNRFIKSKAQTPIPAISGALNSTDRFNRTNRKGRSSAMARRLDTILKRYLHSRQEAEEGMPDTELGEGDSKAEYLKEDISDFKTDQFDDVSQFSGFGEGEPKKEGSQLDESEASGPGGEDSGNEESLYDVDQFSGLAENQPKKEASPEDFNGFSALDDGKPSKGDSQVSGLGVEKDTQELGKDNPKFPGLAEDTPKTQGLSEDEAKSQGLHGMPPAATATPAPRTAVVIRTYSHLNFTENDRQNIRAMVSELSLRSGGEYEIFLLVEFKDETLPIYSDKILYQEALDKSVPKEFQSMSVLWTGAKMREVYPLIPREVNNVHQSHWLSVQWFAQEHPEFDFYWNWEFDTRYTGHYYSLLEKLASFAKVQPRKGLWERNERYYIPSHHGRYSKFIKDVEAIVGDDTVWGAPVTVNVTAGGPQPPVADPKADKYTWGVGEAADYISLSPMFNPVNTSWPGRNDVWGYDGAVATPRRASIGTQSRCSKKLLDTMHAENKKGDHVSSEMTPQTVSLLHGFKAVYAPIPMFFDRSWDGASLQRYFNPGPKGVSGSVEESPFSWGREGRFQGSTWYYRATPPQKLYNNWLGWEDTGVGGAKWEKTHGRTCLPPMLLHPIKNVVEPPLGFSSKSDLPY